MALFFKKRNPFLFHTIERTHTQKGYLKGTCLVLGRDALEMRETGETERGLTRENLWAQHVSHILDGRAVVVGQATLAPHLIILNSGGTLTSEKNLLNAVRKFVFSIQLLRDRLAHFTNVNRLVDSGVLQHQLGSLTIQLDITINTPSTN